MTQIHDLSALELAAAYRAEEISPLEATEHYLERIDAHSATLGAFVTVTADAARAQARKATETMRAARDLGQPLPALFGVPTAIKDLHPTAGVRTTYGSAALADYVPDVSDEVVLRVERAGMISLGKTNTPEFGSPCYTEPDESVAPPARSAYDLTRSAGGSSGGAAAAVSGGLLPIAQASDGGGSIRIPASVCGLVGFKPGRGRVSKAPTYGDITGLSTAGPMASTVRDSAAFLDALAGPSVGEPTWAPTLPSGETYLGWCDRTPSRLRIARWSDAALSPEPVDPEVLAAYESASALLESLGHEIIDVPAPIAPDVLPTFEIVWAVSTAMAPVPAELESRLRPLTRWLRERGKRYSAPEFGAAMVALYQVAAAAIRSLAEYDAVLTPTLAHLPAAVGELRNDADPAADFAAQVRYTPFTAQWNVTGMPAVSLPMGWSAPRADGSVWPIGVMLAGRPAEDHLLYVLAAQVEEALSGGVAWRRPPIVAQLR
ncbi:MAG: amidase [Nakamurella sp.]